MLAASLLGNTISNNQAPSSYAFIWYCIYIVSCTTDAFERFEKFEGIEGIALVVLKSKHIYLLHKIFNKQLLLNFKKWRPATT